jgi:hypothetical protein
MVVVLTWSILATNKWTVNTGMLSLPFRVGYGVCMMGSMMGSVANLYSLQAIPWMYIDVSMQRNGVLCPGCDGSSTYVVHFGHK